MDVESLNKWKEEFQNERNEQVAKAKQLHFETIKRRKTMELRIRLEAAKEEKRRKEALLERRTQHLEATMRFQKGMKNFKISKEKITLEDALNAINTNNQTQKKRINKNDTNNNRMFVHNNDFNIKLRQNSAPNSMRKSSSVDNINLELKELDYNSHNSFANRSNFKNRFISSAQTQSIHQPLQQQQMEPEDKFKTMLTENQRAIADLNREALKEFQNLVMSEIRTTQNMTPISTNIYVDDDKDGRSTTTNLTKSSNTNAQEIPKDSLIIEDLNSESLDSLENEPKQETEFTSLKLNDLNFDAKLIEIRNHFKQNKDAASEFLANLENRKNYLLQKANEARTDLGDEGEVQKNEQEVKFRETLSKKQPKSILKRCSSDSGVNLFGRYNNSFVQFGLKAEKIEIKDSLEVAKGHTNSKLNETQHGFKKKSVRFAQNEYQSEFDVNRALTDNFLEETVVPVAFHVEENRPNIKPRRISNTQAKKVDEDYFDDGKPPLPSPALNNNSYLLLNQKRKELNTKFKTRNEFLATNPKETETQIHQQSELDNSLSTYNNKYGLNVITTAATNETVPLIVEQKRSILTQQYNFLPHQQNFFNADTRLNNTAHHQQSQHQQHTQNTKVVTRIPPQSPKTYYKSYFNTTSVVEIQELQQGINLLKRPMSANTPITNLDLIQHQQQIQPQQLQIPKLNGNHTNNFNKMNQTLPMRILSADHVNHGMKNRRLLNSPVIQLKMQFPNTTTQTNQETDSNVTLSVAEFLRNEELCKSENIENVQKKNPSMLSIEEQNIRNSIQKLNDRLYDRHKSKQQQKKKTQVKAFLTSFDYILELNYTRN